MIPHPPRATRTDTHRPSTALFGSDPAQIGARIEPARMRLDLDEQLGGPRRTADRGLAPQPPDDVVAPLGEITDPWGQPVGVQRDPQRVGLRRSEEHTSELQSLMRRSYAVFCLKKKKKTSTTT